MGIPVVYRKDREKIIQSYNYLDIANGTGTAEFYLCQEQDSSGTGQFLTTKTLYSSSESLANNVANNIIEIEKDFDIKFNTQRIISGNIYFNIQWYMGGGNSDQGGSFITCELKHYDGTTETTLGSSVTSQTISKTYSGQIQQGAFLMKTTTGKVQFKKDDIMRATIKLTTYANNGMTLSCIGTDPANRTIGTMPSSSSKIIVNFDLDL